MAQNFENTSESPRAMQTFCQKKALGQRLIDEGLLTPHQLQTAVQEQRRTGEQLGKILHDLGFVTEDTLSATLQAEFGGGRVSIADVQPETGALQMVPPALAREHELVPLTFSDGMLTIAIADPCNIVGIDAVRKAAGHPVDVVAAAPAEIRVALNRFYSDSTTHDLLIENVIQNAYRGSAAAPSEEAADQAPIIRLVDNLIIKALKDRATDIHIEPEEKLIRTRYRIDGILHQGPIIPKELQSALISRIKIAANLDISERRIPQDGRMRHTTDDRTVDLRISVYPTVNGENVVMRVLDKSSLTLRLAELGFSDIVQEKLKLLVQEPHGMLLVTGPTGSGKTTTLYSLLAEVNSLEKNVATIEDPIEYQFPMIRQSQIAPKIGLTFAAGLRALLRQDPDVIMLGEVRDTETARIAISAALTGHLVLTTLHTNTAAGALPRLMDMEIEPFLLSSSITGILAQRLVRCICSECKEEYEASPSEAELLGCEPGRSLSRGRGCPHCRNTGYRGRTAIYELILPSKNIRRLVLARASEDEIAEAAVQDGTRPMQSMGIKHVLQGITTAAEVARVCKTTL